MSDVLIATFTANSTTSSVSFPVLLDNVVEGNETFEVVLRVPTNLSPSIVTGRPSSAMVIIIDSTGIMNIQYSIKFLS